ncbi:MAG: hypothetical protein AB1847_14100 [bacterium]
MIIDEQDKRIAKILGVEISEDSESYRNLPERNRAGSLKDEIKITHRMESDAEQK